MSFTLSDMFGISSFTKMFGAKRDLAIGMNYQLLDSMATADAERALAKLFFTEDAMIREVLQDDDLLEWTQQYMYKMVKGHFDNEVDETGKNWAPLSLTTLSLRSRGISRIGSSRFGRRKIRGSSGGASRSGFRPSNGFKPLNASGEYYKSWLHNKDKSIHYKKKRNTGATVAIGSRHPQNFNEEGGYIKSKLFKGKFVPSRPVAFFTDTDIDDIVEHFEEHFTDWLMS